jgi:hypothetical protein
MKIVFVDIDGVICLRSSRYLYFDPEAVKRLQNILEVTGANVVISSAWRVGETIEGLRDIFKICGDRYSKYKGPIPYFDISRIIDKTPCTDIDRSDRGDEGSLWGRGYEIVTWLKKYEKELDVKKYIILDDETTDLQPLLNFCVKTETETGLTEEIAQEIIKRLGVQ